MLVLACVAVFVGMSLSRISPAHPASQQLVRWGANFGPLTLGGQWWRLLSSVFLHIGIVHLAVNMWCLWDLGSFAERLYGRATFLAIFLMTGIAGAMFSLLWHPFAIEAGASGAIFGIAGALMASFFLGHERLPRDAGKGALLSIVAFAAYNLFIGAISSGAGNAAHIGGLVFGFAIGLLLARFGYSRRVLAASALALILGGAPLARARGYVVPAEQGRTALAAGHTDAAIRSLNDSVRRNPNYAEGYFMLAQAYMQKQQYPAAEAAYRRALALDPSARDVRYQLGMALVAQSRAKEALETFRELARRDPASSDAQMGIGTAAMIAGDYQLAVDAYRRATKLDPANPQPWTNLGLAALQLRQYDEAIAAFSKCVDLQPDSSGPLLNLAIAYKARGMDQEAQETYRRAQELLPKEK